MTCCTNAEFVPESTISRLGMCRPQKKQGAHTVLAEGVNRLNVAGAPFFVAGMLMLLGIVRAEATYPGYSVSQNYISDFAGVTHGTMVQPAAIAAFSQQRAPIRYFSVSLGVIELVFSIGHT